MNTTQLKTVITFFKKSPSVDIKTDGNNLVLANNDLYFSGTYYDADDYLLDVLRANQADGSYLAQFDGLELRGNHTVDSESLAYCAKAMPKKDIRYYLNGIAVYDNGGICATDGHRLHCDNKALNAVRPKERDDPVIVDKQAVNLAVKLFKKANVDLTLYDGFASFSVGDHTITGKTIDGKYPDIARVIPKHNRRTVYHAPAQKELNLMVSVVKQYDGKYGGVKVETDGAPLVNKNGELSPVPGIAFKLFDIEQPMGFNAVYLRDAIRQGSSTVHTGKPTESIRIDNENLVAVVMPLRL